MYELLKDRLLRLLKVPPEPDDPLGDGESLLVFRAAPNYLRYKLVLWAIGQVFLVSFLLALVGGVAYAAYEATGCVDIFLNGLALVLLVGVCILPLCTYMLVRLDYEMRWYKVTDKTLRIREGVVSVREMTMTFANIQNISISQGPLQRLLEIADLKVQSAGGGGAMAEQQQGHAGFDMHTGYFRGVDNAEEIRDLMRERLRALRDAGLGDPDRVEKSVVATSAAGASSDLALVLDELRDEAGLFRRAAERLGTV